MMRLLLTLVFSFTLLCLPAQIPEATSDSVLLKKSGAESANTQEPEHKKGMLLYFLIAVIVVGGIVMYVESKKKSD